MVGIHDLRKSPHWSYSAINTYLNICSLRYRFEYIERLEHERNSVCLPFGKAFHAAMSEYALLSMKGVSPDSGLIAGYFSDMLIQECAATVRLQFKEGEDINTLNELGRRMIEVAIEKWRTDEAVIAVAQAFSIDLPQLSRPLIGEFDCVALEADGKPVIVDWKTSGTKWSSSKADRDLQATCFSFAYRAKHKQIPKFRFDVITKTKTPSADSHYTRRTEDDMLRFLKMLSEVERAIQKEVFLPSETSFFCGECPFKDACKNWHRNKNKTVRTTSRKEK